MENPEVDQEDAHVVGHRGEEGEGGGKEVILAESPKLQENQRGTQMPTEQRKHNSLQPACRRGAPTLRFGRKSRRWTHSVVPLAEASHNTSGSGRRKGSDLGRKSRNSRKSKEYNDANRERQNQARTSAARERRSNPEARQEEQELNTQRHATRRQSQQFREQEQASQNEARDIERELRAQQRAPTYRAVVETTIDGFEEADMSPLFRFPHDVGPMVFPCPFCDALLYSGETPSLCCGKGKFKPESFPDPPPLLKSLYERAHPSSHHFLKHIRGYNNALALASLEAEPVSFPNGVYNYKVKGRMAHRLATAIDGPAQGEQQGHQNQPPEQPQPPPQQQQQPPQQQPQQPPQQQPPTQHQQPPLQQQPPSTNSRYLGLYFHGDGELQLRNQQGGGRLQEDLLHQLQEELKESNDYVRQFRCLMDYNTRTRVVIKPKKHPAGGAHPRTYNAPTTGEVAALITDSDVPLEKQDLVLYLRQANPDTRSAIQRVPATHRSYDALFYVLLLPWGTDGFEVGMRSFAGQKLTIAKYYRYHFFQRRGQLSHLILARTLMQQFATDVWVK